MTNAIEVTKRAMQECQKEMLNDPYMDGCSQRYYRLSDIKFGVFENAYEAHLEALRQEDAAKAARIGELYSTVQQWQDLHAELQAKFEEKQEVLTKADMLNRSYARQLDGAEQGQALMTVLGALVDAQRIMTDWLVPDGVRARDTVKALLPVLDNEKLVLAMREFEKTKTGE